jgi:predicted transcriptional regulator
MPHGITKRVIERKKAILEILSEEGCKSTHYLVKVLNATHVEVYYALKSMEKEGYVKRWTFGRVAIWCVNEEQYKQFINTLASEIRKIVENNRWRYVYPIRLYRALLENRRVYRLLSQLIPMDHNNAAILTFINHVLRVMYGEPYFEGEKIVYYVANGPAGIEKKEDTPTSEPGDESQTHDLHGPRILDLTKLED